MQSETMNSVLLCSGGLDSTVLAYWLRDQKIGFAPLFIDYGQHCAKTELERLHDVLPVELVASITKIDVSGVYRYTSSRLIKEADLWSEKVSADDLYLPYRNLLLLTIGAAFAQSKGMGSVYSAFINSNHAKEIDCSARFFDNLTDMMKDYGSVEVRMPFRDMSKYEVANLGLTLGAPIAKTFSCQVSSVVPCGVCPNCVDRLQALAQLS